HPESRHDQRRDPQHQGVQDQQEQPQGEDREGERQDEQDRLQNGVDDAQADGGQHGGKPSVDLEPGQESRQPQHGHGNDQEVQDETHGYPPWRAQFSWRRAPPIRYTLFVSVIHLVRQGSLRSAPVAPSETGPLRPPPTLWASSMISTSR